MKLQHKDVCLNWPENTHGSCIHLSYPHMPHSYGKAPRWHCSAFSRAWSTASTAAAPGKWGSSKGAVTHTWRLRQLPAPAAQCLPAADFPNSSVSAEKLQLPQRQGREHEWLLTGSTVHVLGVLSKHKSSNLCSRFPKTSRGADKAKWH